MEIVRQKMLHNTSPVARASRSLVPLFFCSLFLGSTTLQAQSVDSIMNEIQKLEGRKDPKCYATASRLEDFMYGTPLSDEARFAKNLLQKQWAKEIWTRASAQATKAKASEVEGAHVLQALPFSYTTDESGHWVLSFPGGADIRIHKDDKRHYGSVAYSLRALLAVQQEALLEAEMGLLQLSQSGVDSVKEALDLFTLAALKIADNKARLDNVYEVDETTISEVWLALLQKRSEPVAEETKTAAVAATPRTPVELQLTRSIINQKVASFAAYNQISNQLFVRNLQVYFARSSWPKDPQTGKQFKNLFTETLIVFANDLYKGVEQVALKNGHNLILEADVHEFVNDFIPHIINDYEDAVFFPNLPRQERVYIEAYDMDAFRDSGIHWRYLQYAINDPKFVALLEADPFALEMIVENIAQFGVLSLRLTGEAGRAKGEKRLALAHFSEAMQTIQQRVAKHKGTKKRVSDSGLVSASSPTSSGESDALFTELSAQLGINFEHRSSDWLNRLLRSYLRKDESTGIITIPPAFGGSGVAAEDVNGDGLPDLLILSGLGNRLYLNRDGKRFEDVTEKAGLNWQRNEDNHPGEPRQPLIADLNNDGLQDIVITYVDDTHRVYRNLGNERFEDVTAQAGLGGKSLVGGPATVFDFDNDGQLDIYITYFGDYIHGVLPTLKRRNDNGLPNRLFRNTGNFKFEDVTEGSSLAHTGWGQAVAHTDLDGDGWQDLIVGNDFGVNAYYRNLGNGKFKEISAELGTDKPSYTMNIGLADLNGDLHPDIYISNIVTMNKDEKYVLPGEQMEMKFNPDKLAHMRVVEANDLFISSRGEGTLPEYALSHAVGRGYSSTGWSWDADFFDFDNDGDEDLYVLNGMNEFNLYSSENPYYMDPLENKKKAVYIPVSTKESNVFFINDAGKLHNVSKKSGADLIGNSRSAAYLDFDQDGDLDMVLNNYHEAAVFYRNNSEQFANNWLRVRLIGDPTKGVSRDAIGARIIATTADGKQSWREVHGSIGYMSVHPKQQHIGLGKSQLVDLQVIWPGGEEQSFKGIKANSDIRIEQATGKVVTVGG